MSENDKFEGLEDDGEVVEYVLDDAELGAVTSSEFVGDDELFARVENDLEELFAVPEPPTPAVLLAADDEIETKPVDPVFEALALPILPDLEKENRARLQMQSPNRLYFYWSIKNNPYQTLQRVFGAGAANYRLVAKLVNLATDREEIHPIEAEGNWWYNVESNAEYRVEIGFYAPNRPFVRVMFSNIVETPRKSPSPRQATDADWAITAYEFAEVLDVSGFTRDAFEVALAGDDADLTEAATGGAFAQLLGRGVEDFNPDEVRYALLALASGIGIETLRGQISEALYLVLSENSASLGIESTMSALRDHFEIVGDEIIEFEEAGEAVFGASLVNFPVRRVSKSAPKTGIPTSKVRFVPRLEPVSSFGFGRRER